MILELNVSFELVKNKRESILSSGYRSEDFLFIAQNDADSKRGSRL
jgi:hypothetical protein